VTLCFGRPTVVTTAASPNPARHGRIGVEDDGASAATNLPCAMRKFTSVLVGGEKDQPQDSRDHVREPVQKHVSRDSGAKGVVSTDGPPEHLTPSLSHIAVADCKLSRLPGANSG
jgi:hypothetical protein